MMNFSIQMHPNRIAALLTVFICMFFVGCGGKTDPFEIACEKLEIKHCKRYSTSINSEINKKIADLLGQKTEELQSKLDGINRKLDPFASKTFLVDLNLYEDIGRLKLSLTSEIGAKLDRVRVFAVAAPLLSGATSNTTLMARNNLSGHELTARENSPKINKYRQIVELCTGTLTVPCKVNYIGILDGVWTKKESETSLISGWIDYEEIALVPFTLRDLRGAVHEKARKSVFKIIHERGGDITWLQIEAEVDKALSETN